MSEAERDPGPRGPRMTPAGLQARFGAEPAVWRRMRVDRSRIDAFAAPAGARIRGRFVLAGCEARRPGAVTLSRDLTVEPEGAGRPAIAARWMQRWYLEGGT